MRDTSIDASCARASLACRSASEMAVARVLTGALPAVAQAAVNATRMSAARGVVRVSVLENVIAMMVRDECAGQSLPRAPGWPGVKTAYMPMLLLRSEEHTSELQSRFG